jgi:hypothetical protein
MEFTNVVVSEEVVTFKQKMPTSTVSAHPLLEPVIAKLAMLYPLWTFTANGTASMHSVVLTQFTVACDGEKLGTIERRYEGRDYQICVTNERIKASMERSGFYKTMNPDKAVAKVKKMFSPKTTKESAHSAREAAGKAAQTAEWNKTREKDDAHDIVLRAAKKFVMNEGFSIFMDYAKTHYPRQEHELLVSKMETFEAAKQDLVTITAVREVLRNGKGGAVISRRGATYVVEHSDNVEICDDNTLPEWVRNRIGLLKLIEPEQFVSDTGMRATANTFVVLAPENLTTVTEGE